MDEILVRQEHEQGVAAVYRDEDGLWVTHDLGRGAASRIDGGEPVRQGLPGGGVQGGRLPPGADRAFVRDAGGGWTEATARRGAWVVVTGREPVAVRYEDDGGRVVARPLEILERVEATGVDLPCPACDAVAWDTAIVPGGAQVVVCRRCGHRVHGSVWRPSAASPRPRSAPDPAVFARFGAFCLAGWEDERRLAGHGGRPGADRTIVELRSVRLAHASAGAEVTVETESEWHGTDEECLEEALAALRDELGEPPARTAAALLLQLEAARLRASERAAAAAPRAIEIPVAGVARPFLGAEVEGGWAAVGTIEGLAVTITARGVPFGAAALARVRDYAPYLGR